jgi:hypothetical protein
MPNRFDRHEDPRRAFLVKALAAGVFAASGLPAAHAQLLGRRPARMPDDRSFYEVSGDVRVNARAATLQTRVAAGDRVETGAASQAIFVIGDDAYLLRSRSRFETTGSGLVADTLRVVTGALLSVFGRRPKRMNLHTSALGIRGTGLYVETDAEQDYVCTCYGEVSIAAADDPSVSERVATRHHDAPRYVLKSAAQRIRPAPFINHTDLELMLIEALVGRTTPFPLFDEDYGGARRRY